MTEILNVSKCSEVERFLCDQLVADMTAEAFRERVEARKKDLLVSRFGAKKREMDKLQGAVRAESEVKRLTAADAKKYSTHVKMEMPSWTYFQIMMGTNDPDFWTDDKNREKFLRDNPEYSTKTF